MGNIFYTIYLQLVQHAVVSCTRQGNVGYTNVSETET